jgi:hypothetical protein
MVQFAAQSVKRSWLISSRITTPRITALSSVQHSKSCPYPSIRRNLAERNVVEGEEENEWKRPDLKESLPDFRKIMGIQPRVITVDEMLYIAKDPARNYRDELYYNQADELPMTYDPPFPLTPGEERLEKLNQKSSELDSFEKDLPFPSLNEEVNRWYDDLRRHGEAKLDRRIISGDKNSTPIFIHTEPLESKPPDDVA